MVSLLLQGLVKFFNFKISMHYVCINVFVVTMGIPCCFRSWSHVEYGAQHHKRCLVATRERRWQPAPVATTTTTTTTTPTDSRRQLTRNIAAILILNLTERGKGVKNDTKWLNSRIFMIRMAEKYGESSNKAVSCMQNEQQDDDEEIKKLNPIAKALLQGIYDDKCELSKLRGMWHILRSVWRYLISFWKENIKLTDVNPFEGGSTEEATLLLPTSSASFLNLSGFEQLSQFCYYDTDDEREEDDGKLIRNISWKEYYKNYDDDSDDDDYNTIYKIRFPRPTGVNINMMPFIMDIENFTNCQLPRYLEKYWECIIKQCPLGSDQIGKIGYLTIQESHVNKGETQRRPGIHTERPGIVKFRLKQESQNTKKSSSTSAKAPRVFENGESKLSFGTFGWGLGEHVVEEARLKGGIYMASNVSDSCKLYNCEIMDDKLIGELGDIEHLREFMPKGEVMEKDNLYWFTDRTPHEALPLKGRKHRQFFRLVTSQVSLWYIDHSTKNPLGVMPDPKITKIVKGSKFDKEGVVLVKNARGSVSKQRGTKDNRPRWKCA